MRRSLYCGSILLNCCVAALAQVSVNPDTIESRYSAADVVCRCQVSHVSAVDEARAGSSGSRTLFRVSLQVESLYKYLASKDIKELTAMVEGGLDGGSRLRPGNDYIVFLRNSARNNEFDILHAEGAIISLATEKGRDVAHDASGKQDMESEIVILLKNAPDQNYTLYYLNLLSQFAALSESAMTAVDLSTRAESLSVETVALSVAVRQKPSQYMEPFLNHVANLGSVNPPNIDVIGEIVATLPTNKSLKQIERVATSANPYIRRSAMSNIRRNASPGAIPFLEAQLASGDHDVQYLAVITLAEINMEAGDLAPDRESFDKRPAFYVQLWRAWAAANGTKVPKS